MINFEFPVQIGKTTIIIRGEAETQIEAIAEIAAWQGIEVTAGPNGEAWDDLRFCHRVVKDSKGDDCVYQSIVSSKSNMEFKLGMSRKQKGRVFPKYWAGVRRRSAYQDEDLAEDEGGDDGKLESEKLTTASTSKQPQQTATKVSLDPAERARAHVAALHVRVFGQGNARTWRVGPQGTDVEVWKEAGIPNCGCAELAQLRRRDAKAVCEHILAVRFYHEALASSV